MRKNLKKRLAMVLAAAMVFSTPVAVNKTVSVAAEEESAYETLTGTAWWGGAQKGKDYTVDAGSTTILYVKAQQFNGGQGDFSVEVKGVDEKGAAYFLTSGSDGNIWGAGGSEGVGTFDGMFDPLGSKLVEDHIYKITVARAEKDITINYFDATADKEYCNLKWIGGNMPEKAGVHVIAQVGTYLVSANTFTNVSVTGPAIKAEEGAKALAYSFDAIDALAGTGFEVSVSNGTETVKGSAVAAEGGHVTYNYPEKGTLVSGTYTFKVTGVKAGDNANYFLDGDAADSVTVEVKDGVITGIKETVTVKLTDGKAALTADKKSIDYTFKAENAPAKGVFEYEVSKGDAVVATGSAAAVAEVKVNYAPTESGKYSFKVTGVKADESDKAGYVLDGDAAAELDFTVSSGDNNNNQPPATNPPATNPPATNPPATNPPAAGTVKKVTVKAANQKAGTKTVYLKKGGKVTLTATVTGTGKFSKAVTWTSSKKAVATVSSKGVVKAKKAGTAKITVASKTNKAKKATITIKVAKKAKKNKKLTLKAKKKNLKKGKTYTVAIKSMTKGTTDAVTYKTNKKKIATVDKFGVVKAKKKGTAVITVKCGKKKAKLTIKVK
ncbi:MAG: hypothetical protein HFG38_08670 [Eubacterium sp.]|nr:hypothetical protein [Eubacterium sp.]